MIALITGASGFLGGHLLNKLAAYGDVKIIAVQHSGVVYASRDHTVHGSVLDLQFIRNAIARYEVDTVFHLAAQTQVKLGSSDPVNTFDVNVRGTWNVLEACRLECVRRVVVASSDKVYGECENAKENAALGTRCPYSVSKRMAELAAGSYALNYEMSVAISRCGNLYGTGDTNYRRLVPSLCRSIARNESPVLRDRNASVRDYLYVGDAAHALILLARSEHVGAFNFSGGDPKTNVEIAELAIKLAGSDLKVKYEGDATGELKHQTLCCDKARELLGWRPTTSIKDGLSNALRWYKNNS